MTLAEKLFNTNGKLIVGSQFPYEVGTVIEDFIFLGTTKIGELTGEQKVIRQPVVILREATKDEYLNQHPYLFLGNNTYFYEVTTD